MTNFYLRIPKPLRRAGLLALLLGGTAAAAQAQALNYAAAGASAVSGTYADLGTSGTAIATANTDDANSAAQPIGFTFSYNGASFTQFVLNTNGVIRLGSAAPSAADLYYNNDANGQNGVDPLQSTSAADINLLMPFNTDLVPGSGAGGVDYRVLTSGTAPNRVCTIQWRNVADKPGTGSDAANGTQYANFSFQLKLYETTGTVEFVYGQAVPGSAADGTRFPNVGLKGLGQAVGQVTLATKTASVAWNATTFQNSNYTNHANDITKSVTPAPGLTYRFTQAAQLANDIAIQAVYTLGKIATPSALPQPVQVYIANLGTADQTNVQVTLKITGANTQNFTGTLASLPAGAQGTLTLTNLPATLNLGTDSVRVSVPADGNNTNNTAVVTRLVTTNRLSYIDPGKPANGALSYSSNSAGGLLVTKYTIPAGNTVTLADALISFANVTGNPTTAYQVVVYDATGTGGTPGNLLYAAPNQNRPAAGGDVTTTLPALQLTGSFFVGLKEIGNTGAGIATQAETPLRTGVFYYSGDGTAWNDAAATTLQVRFAIEVGLAPAPSCAVPTGLAVTAASATTATVTFADAGNAGSYQLIYGPVGFQPATSGTTVAATASPFTLTGLQSGATYQLYARTSCTGGGTSLLAGPVTFSTGCPAVTTVTDFPYVQNFDNVPAGSALPCGITVLDANADGTTWAITKTTPNSSPNAIRYTSTIPSSPAADDWFFTPALTTTATTRYQVAFRYRAEGIPGSASSFIEKLEVKAGATATPADQTTTLYTNINITTTDYALADGTSTPVVATFAPGAGTQYVGFHVISSANQGNLYVDDLTIMAAAVTATTSAALLQAVTVFPNPSTTGLFDLEIHGANAKGALGVQVTNVLGQAVYTGTARDNYTNRLDLSGLAPGFYHLQVRNGEETMTRQLAISK
ncbi:T9SS type A sorting domain-containing protein [Hymenobacter psoromatis]|uniref:T9SS type A sorting domain-containing protein n=1 Tax=Hymenobacter psoromatis TaxID=1484116 RepID=UPI001CC19E51|nr:T9SS type A sorting domain-containing protein [Hymenobacter psoromatis]